MGYLLDVIKTVDLCLPSFFNEAVEIAQNFHVNKISQEEYDAACDTYWEFIDQRNAVTTFNDKDILYARIAISLLSTTRYLDEASRGVEWFIQLLSYLGMDTKPAIDLLEVHFEKKGIME